MTISAITASDNHTLDCYFANPNGTVRGGIVLLQEIFGVTDQLKNVADRYAELGLSIAVPALFDRQARNSVVPFDKADQGLALMGNANAEKTMLDINATVQSLRKQTDKVIVMGFCWGGGLALRAAQQLLVDGAIVFYGTRLQQCVAEPLTVPCIGHFGTDDPHTPADVLADVRSAFPDMEIHMYKAGHAFANDARDVYLESAATLAHERNSAFLDKLIRS